MPLMASEAYQHLTSSCPSVIEELLIKLSLLREHLQVEGKI
jgi:hypothetical protein